MKKSIIYLCVFTLLFSVLPSISFAQTVQTPPSQNQKMLIMGGSNDTNTFFNDIWSTSDMSTWVNVVPLGTKKTVWTPRNLIRTLYLNGLIYLIGGEGNPGVGQENEMWSSQNGITWKKLPKLPWSSDPYEHSLEKTYIVFSGKIWALGGANHDPAMGGYHTESKVWSFDGTTWKSEVDAPWSGRASAGAVVYDSKLWLIGGFLNSTNLTNEVWSFDGTTWRQETSLPYQYTFASGLQPVALNDKIWIIGSTQFGTNSVLSYDGETWQQTEAPWGTRSDQVDLVFNNKIYVLGGLHQENMANSYFNDVWGFDGYSWQQMPFTPWLPRGYFDAVVVPENISKVYPPLPDGCTSSEGFSPKTGVACSPQLSKPIVPNQNAEPSCTSSVITSNLRLGSKGKQVTQLQAILIQQGYLPSGTPSDYFGSRIQNAVKKFQRAVGVSPSGNTGPATRLKLNTVNCK